MYRAVLATMTLALVMAACADETEPGDTAVPTDAPPTSTPTPTPTGEATDGDPDSVAVADLAAHLGVDPAEIEVVSSEEVTWRDGSLGCPEPGESYIQALTDGYRIVLRAGGEEYFYHGASGEPPSRCEDPDPNGAVGGGAGDAAPAPDPPDDGKTLAPATPADPPEEDDMTDRDGPVAEAIADLANQTGVDPADIDVVAHDQVTWRDGSLGCPKPGMMYTQALVDGYRIVLRAGGQQVSYHGANGKSPFRCDKPEPNGAVSTQARQ